MLNLVYRCSRQDGPAVALTLWRCTHWIRPQDRRRPSSGTSTLAVLKTPSGCSIECVHTPSTQDRPAESSGAGSLPLPAPPHPRGCVQHSPGWDRLEYGNLTDKYKPPGVAGVSRGLLTKLALFCRGGVSSVKGENLVLIARDLWVICMGRRRGEG